MEEDAFIRATRRLDERMQAAQTPGGTLQAMDGEGVLEIGRLWLSGIDSEGSPILKTMVEAAVMAQEAIVDDGATPLFQLAVGQLQSFLLGFYMAQELAKEGVA